MSELPLAITLGEPAGIGPEVILKAWLRRKQDQLAAFFVLGSVDHLQAVARQLNLNVPVEPISDHHEAEKRFLETLPVIDLPLNKTVVIGTPAIENADCVTGAISAAVDMARQGVIGGMVTAPIQKSILYDSGFRFEGHTDFIAALCGDGTTSPHSLQMLTDGELRTVPVTVHIPIIEVANALNEELILLTLQIAHRALSEDYGIEKPRLAVTGLNPHAGENGKMGLEEVELIAPVISKAQQQGLDVQGPFAADALFSARERVKYDMIITMYHDQSLIPIKALNFDKGVNVTLGLPIVRTSPDHGTALGIAGEGVASPESIIAAIKEASVIAKARKGLAVRDAS